MWGPCRGRAVGVGVEVQAAHDAQPAQPEFTLVQQRELTDWLAQDPARFARSSDAGAYAGLVPRRNQSGERDHKGRISKAGDPMLRHALYEAANSLLVRVKRPSPLQTWGKALAQTKGPKRARVAVARKLAILLHRLWQSDTAFCWQ